MALKLAPLLLFVASVAMSAYLAMVPRDDRAVAAVFPPWWGGAKSFAAAARAGAVLRQGRWPWIVVVATDGPEAVERLHRVGALLLVDPTLSGLCNGSPAGPTMLVAGAPHD